MSGNDNIDRELESFMQDDSRIAALYRKLPRAEPDAKLDAAVLALARGAVPAKRSRPRWMPALSAAAIVLFAVGVAYRVGPQVWNDRDGLAKPGASQSAMEKKVAPPAESASVPQAAAAAPALPVQRDAEAFPSDSAVKMAKPKPAPDLRAPVAAPARQKTAAGKIAPQPMASPALTDELRADRISGGAARMQAQPQSPPPPSQSAPLQSPDATIFPGKEQEKRDAAANRAAAMKDKSEESRSEAALSRMGEAPAPGAPARTVSPPTPPPAADPNIHLYPESWIANIQKMLRENRRDDAIRSLGEFRKKYPDYRLPDDLRDLK